MEAICKENVFPWRTLPKLLKRVSVGSSSCGGGGGGGRHSCPKVAASHCGNLPLICLNCDVSCHDFCKQLWLTFLFGLSVEALYHCIRSNCTVFDVNSSSSDQLTHHIGKIGTSKAASRNTWHDFEIWILFNIFNSMEVAPRCIFIFISILSNPLDITWAMLDPVIRRFHFHGTSPSRHANKATC